MKFAKIWESKISAQELAANQSSGGEKIAYSLFCIFTIIIISNISFIVLLNCLYLNPQVSLFVHFSSPPCWGGRGGASEQLSNA